jgi:pimeloyl-ACP methyl ester carboxylesterase
LAVEFYNPVTISSVTLGGRPVPLARDITAPMAYALSQTKREYLTGFLQPESTSQSAGLYMLEPYQPGKIPVVLIHGLLSSRLTWASVANEIYAAPDLNRQIQVWVYEYDTGEPFLRSAANLRQRLRQIQEHFDPANMDPALRQMVLVGHSMGGLIAKLQVTQSGTIMWDSISCESLETIYTSPEVRQRLANLSYFKPSRSITRVVFMATPHQGSPWAEGSLGRIASALVNEPFESQDAHEQLIDDNPVAFTDEFSWRIPTSVDLLKPGSHLLQAMDRLPYSRSVQLPTIAGTGFCIPGAVDSDRVVPLDSARKPGVVTERLIESKHDKIHHSPDGVQELLCILRNHVRAASCR